MPLASQATFEVHMEVIRSESEPRLKAEVGRLLSLDRFFGIVDVVRLLQVSLWGKDFL